MRIVWIVVAATLSFACGKRDEPAPPPPPPEKPVRGAAGDSDLRVMLAEIASSRACDMMRGSMRGIRAEHRKDLTTGVLWIRDCKITNEGTKVRFQLGGHGWQWNETTEKKAGGTFELREYVKFAVKATIRGTLDIAYDKADHVVSLWFSPTQSPDIQFTPVGDVDVDAKGLWSSVIGGVSSIFVGSPEQQGKEKAEKLGKQQFEHELVRGMTVAIDLCTGYQRFSIGRAPKGNLGPPDPGESRNTEVEIEPGGLMAFGPYEAPKGMHITVHSDGPVRMGIACSDQVYSAAEAFIAEKEPELVDTLAQTDVHGTGKLEVKAQKCKVAVVARSIANHKVTFDWQRPPREIAHSTGGPAIHCERKQTVSSDRDGGDRPAAARRR